MKESTTQRCKKRCGWMRDTMYMCILVFLSSMWLAPAQAQLTQTEEFKLISERIVKSHKARETTEKIDAKVDALLIKYVADATVEIVLKDNNQTVIGSIFNDIDYLSQQRSAWTPKDHVTNIGDMANAYTRQDSKYYADVGLHDKIVKLLKFWEQARLVCPNWWHNQIGWPKPMGIALLYMRDGALQVPTELETAILEWMRAKGGNPTGQAGPNKTDIALHWMYRALLTEDVAILKTAASQAFIPLKTVSPSAEGIQQDNSYYQHGRQLQIASYGGELVNTTVEFLEYFEGTQYAVAPASLASFSKFARETFFGSTRGGYFPYLLNGRGITRSNNTLRKGSIDRFAKSLATTDPTHKDEYDLINRRANGTDPGEGITPRSTIYYLGDYISHNRPGYQYAIRTVSNRTLRSEWGNSEGFDTYFTSDGGNAILQKGDEYGNIFATWDWSKLPGVTSPLLPRGEIPNCRQDQGSGSSTWGTHSFVGGASDSKYSAYAYTQHDTWAINNRKGKRVAINTMADKAWFLFDDEIVCLGTGLTSTATHADLGDLELITGINQARLVGTVAVGSTDGGVEQLGLGTMKQYDNTMQWAVHNEIGYVFPKGGQVRLENATKSGAWKDNNYSQSDKIVKDDIFALWFSHGKAPIGHSYAYFVVPNTKDAAAMQTYYAGKYKDVEILQNDESIQAVRHKGLGIWQLVFRKAATFTHNELTITADKSMVVMVQDIDTDAGTAVLNLADPAQTGRIVTLGVNILGVTNAMKQVSADYTTAGNHKGRTTKIMIDDQLGDYTSPLPVDDNLPLFAYESVVTSDSYVSGVSTDRNKNFGNNPRLVIKRDTEGYARRAFIKVSLDDLSKIGSVLDYKLNVSLSLHLMRTNGGAASTTWNLYPVTQEWNEEEVTWNNQPKYSSEEVVGTIKGRAYKGTILGVDEYSAQDVLNIDITQYALNEYKAGKRELNLLFYNDVSNGTGDFDVASKDHTNELMHPKLVIEGYKKEAIEVVAAPTATLLDVKFGQNGEATDVSQLSHTITKGVGDSPATAYDGIIKQYVSNFNRTTADTQTYYKVDYKDNNAFKNQLGTAFSFEVYAKHTGKDLMSSAGSRQDGGFGWRQQVDGGLNEFGFATATGTYTQVGKASSYNSSQFYSHALVTYDGTTLHTYYDGVLEGSKAAGGNLTFSANEAAHWIAIGGNASLEDKAEDAFAGDIALVRMYDKAVSQAEVVALYKQIEARGKLEYVDLLQDMIATRLPVFVKENEGNAVIGAKAKELTEEALALMNNLATTDEDIQAFELKVNKYVPEPEPEPALLTAKSKAKKDAYVEGGGSKTKNFGTTENLTVKFSSTGTGDGAHRDAYYMFALDDLAPFNTEKYGIKRAYLALYHTGGGAQGATVNWTFTGVSDLDWVESPADEVEGGRKSITIMNRPTGRASKPFLIAPSFARPTTPILREFDVTDYVLEQLAAGKTGITININNDKKGTGGNNWNSAFASKEHATEAYHPHIVIEYIELKKPVTVSPITFANKEYDGKTTTIIENPETITLTGVAEGDEVSIDFSSFDPRYADANVGDAKAITVDGYLRLTGKDAIKYKITQPAFDGYSANISKAVLTIAARPQSMVKAADPSTINLAGAYDIQGLKNKETEAVISGAITVSLSAAITNNAEVGVYPDAVTVSGGSSANYNLTYVPANFTITAMSGEGKITFPTITGTLKYGNADFNLSATHEMGKSITYTSSNNAIVQIYEESAGVYKAKIVGVGDVTITAKFDGDIEVGASSEAQILAIGKGELKVVASPILRKYQASNPIVTDAYTVEGLVNEADRDEFITKPTVAIDEVSAVGTHPGAVKVSGGEHPKYELTYVHGTLTITKTEAEITIQQIANKTYGNSYFPLTASHVGGSVVTFESVTPTIVKVELVENQWRATILAAGAVDIIAKTVASATHEAATKTITVTVNKKALTIKPANIKREFGTVNPELTLSISGLEYSDTVADLGTIEVTTTAAEDSPVADYPITATGASNDNYTISYNAGVLTIEKAKATLSLVPQEVTYTGSNLMIKPAVLAGTKTPNKEITYTYKQGEETTTHALNAGTYEVIASLEGDDNHTGAVSASVGFVVKKATVNIGLAAKGVTYTGSPITPGNPLITGSSTVMNLTFVTKYMGIEGTSYTETTDAPSDVGKYSVTMSTQGDANHNSNSITATLTISKGTETAGITFSADNFTYDGTAKTLVATTAPEGLAVTYSYAGTLRDGTEYPTSDTAPTQAGDYTVTADFAGDDTYVPSSISGNFAIAKKASVITLTAKTETYTGAPITIDTPTIDPLGGTATITYALATRRALRSGTQAPTNVGTYVVTATYAGDNNHTPQVATTELKITSPGEPTLLLPSRTTTYSGVAQVIGTAEITLALAKYLTVSYTYSNADYTSSATPPTNAGVYAVTARTATDVNFPTAGEITSTLTINKADQTITFNKAQLNGLAIGGEAKALVASSNTQQAITFVSDNNAIAEIVDGKISINTTGPVTITAQQAADANYNYSSVSHTITIAKAVPIIVLKDENVTYTGENLRIEPPSVTGLVPGATSLPITYSYNKDGVTTSSALVAGSYTVIASIAGDDNYEAASSNPATYTVKKGTAKITLTSKDVKYTGQAIKLDNPNISGSTTVASLSFATHYEGIDGTNYPSSTTAPNAVGKYKATVSTAGDANHDASSNSTILTISKAGAVVTITDDAIVYDGTAKKLVASTTPTGLTIAYSYEGKLADGTDYTQTSEAPIHAGIYDVKATFAGNEYYEASHGNAKLTINKKAASIVMTNKSVVYTGSAISIDKPVTDPADATLVITYTAVTRRFLRSNTEAPTNVGTYLVEAIFAGNNNYEAATATGELKITPLGTLALTMLPKEVVYTGEAQSIDPATITTVGAEHLAITYKYENATYPSTSVAPTDAGIYKVTATTATDDVFLVAGEVTATLTIKKADQTLVFDKAQLEGFILTDATFSLVATSNTNTPIVFTSGNTAIVEINGGVATIKATGTTMITATQQGNNNYNEATLIHNITIAASKPIVTLESNQKAVYTGESLRVKDALVTGITEGVKLNVVYEYTKDGLTADHALAAGTYSVIAKVEGNDKYASATSLPVEYVVAKAEVEINLTGKSVSYTGSSISIDAPEIVGGTAQDDLSFKTTYLGVEGTSYPGSQQAPTNKGKYQVTVSTLGDTNHKASSSSVSLTITQDGAVITLTNASFVYDGTAKTLVATIVPSDLPISYTYTGILADGKTYTESDQGPIEAGKYDVVAKFAGNVSYEPATATAELTITKKVSTITLVSKSTEYTGSAISIDKPVTDPADANLVITYTLLAKRLNAPTTIAPTNVGDYAVKAEYAGDNNHEPATKTTELKITSLGIPTLTIESKTVVYDGTAQTANKATITTAKAAHLSITYTYKSATYPATATAPTHAGVYSVTATTSTDVNFPIAGEATTTLTISKATQTIIFDVAQLNGKSIGDADFSLVATSSSNLPVTFVSGNPLIAEITGNIVSIKQVEAVTITATQAGNENYEAATSVVGTLVITGTSYLEVLSVNDETLIESTTGVYHYVVAKDNTAGSLTISGKTDNSSQIIGLPEQIDISKPSVQEITFSVAPKTRNAATNYKLIVEKRFNFENLVTVRWNNTLSVNTKDLGFEFTAYQWYENGLPITGATQSSYSAGKYGELLNDNATYYVDVTDKATGKVLRCWDASVELGSKVIVAYPNPVKQSQILTIYANVGEELLKDAKVFVYSIEGQLVKSQVVKGAKIEVTMPATIGTYIVRLIGSNGFTHNFTIIVK